MRSSDIRIIITALYIYLESGEPFTTAVLTLRSAFLSSATASKHAPCDANPNSDRPANGLLDWIRPSARLHGCALQVREPRSLGYESAVELALRPGDHGACDEVINTK